MHPPLQIKTIFNTNAWHTARRFAFSYFPGEIQPGLTKVNKPVISNSKSNACKCMIFPLVKPYNNICDRNLTKPRMYLINVLPYYHIDFLISYFINLLTFYHINPSTYSSVNLLTFYHITPLTFYPNSFFSSNFARAIANKTTI